MCKMRDLDEKARQAEEKKAALGADIELDDYQTDPVSHDYVENLEELPDADKERMILAGVDTKETDRSGTYVQKDSTVVHSHSKQEGLEVISIKEALKKHDWIEDYYWNLVSVDTDKYTARAQLDLHDGYVIRALPGSQVIYPVQACLYLEKESFSQNVHNIIIAEEDSELHIITGCATAAHLRRGLHVGISEFYVKKNAKLSFTMIHNWAEEVMVRPRSVGRVEEGGLFL
ncbi:MAG: SufD family Fe-S cluster assembly protein, partial [Deltaproteobacteria bacterium]|nr:SufD family Fe-S cluster assembly protein [Deltaproteobacteria bacterium]